MIKIEEPKDYELEWIEAERTIAVMQWENWEYLHRELKND
jgi:hypothetical protein